MNQVESTLVRKEIQIMLRKGAIQCISIPSLLPPPPKKGVYKQSLCGKQERWRSQTGNKPKKFEQLSARP